MRNQEPVEKTEFVGKGIAVPVIQEVFSNSLGDRRGKKVEEMSGELEIDSEMVKEGEI